MRRLLRRAARNRSVAATLLVALLALCGVEVRALADDDRLPEVPGEARAFVGRFAVAVTSFDHKRVAADVEEVLAFGTPGFERDFRAAMGADFTERVTANRTVSTGTVVAGPQVQRRTGDRASLLVVVDQRVTSEGSEAEPQIVRVGLLVTVQAVDGDPRIGAVQVL